MLTIDHNPMIEASGKQPMLLQRGSERDEYLVYKKGETLLTPQRLR
jgi:hypothetical protein